MLIMWMFTSMMRKKNLQIELYGLSSCQIRGIKRGVFAKQGSIEELPNIKVKAHLLSQHLEHFGRSGRCFSCPMVLVQATGNWTSA